MSSSDPAEIIAVAQGEAERRMSDLSVPGGANSHGKGRLSARGNWHTRLRIGIMGGTFDPIHNGHLVAASEVAWVYDLDEVIFVPTGRPVFKLDKEVTNAEDRYLMTVIATASNPKFTVSRVDIDRPGVTYTIDTLKDIRAQHPDAELFFITGADAVAEIMQWKDADLMWDLAHFVAVTRPGYSSPDGVTLPEGKVDTLEIPALAISSTDVRRRAEHDEPVWYLVPDGVVQYIGKTDCTRARADAGRCVALRVPASAAGLRCTGNGRSFGLASYGHERSQWCRKVDVRAMPPWPCCAVSIATGSSTGIHCPCRRAKTARRHCIRLASAPPVEPGHCQ